MPKKPASPPKVKPAEGWRVDSAHGSLQTRAGVLLVRLEDVHAGMCSAGMPPNEATRKLFGPFYNECIELTAGNSVDVPLLREVHIASALERPVPLWSDGALNKAGGAQLYAQLPDLGHVNFESGTLGATVDALGEAALRLWHGAADVSTDHFAARQEETDRKSDAHHRIYWPSDDALRQLLGRLAVSHELAHGLWGWGTVVPAVDVAEVPAISTSEQTSTPTEVQPPAFTFTLEFIALCKERKDSKGNSWTDQQKSTLWSEICKFPNRARGLRLAMAKALGLEDAEAVSKMVRGKKRPTKLATVTVVKDGEKAS